ncbi:MAG: hypothetical protein DCC65_02435 [Planctomycetota bacterium]|nr:MAG: hypothetical protein DCC65_02435 [Planctomycetota bacterium]
MAAFAFLKHVPRLFVRQVGTNALHVLDTPNDGDFSTVVECLAGISKVVHRVAEVGEIAIEESPLLGVEDRLRAMLDFVKQRNE